MKDYKVAIILPTIDNLQYLKVTLRCLFASTKFPYKLLLIDGVSTDGTSEYCDYLAKSYDNIEAYHISRAGLPNAINFGIRKAGDLDVYITQDDVIHYNLMGRDWLAEMHESSKGKDVGQVTCIRGMGISGPTYVDGMKWVGTWAMYLSRRTINEIGFFDEEMRAGDDLDYSYRCMKKKKGIMVIDYWVQHHRLSSHSPGDTEEVKEKMSQYFKKKWGDELKEYTATKQPQERYQLSRGSLEQKK